MKTNKKVTALILCLTLTFASSVLCLANPATADTPADKKAFVTFVYGGNTKGEWVIKGTNVTAPEVPVLNGLTFCGWSAPLTNIQTDQLIYAIYKPTNIGEAALAEAKKSLPAPAISATKAADPNAVTIIPMPVTVSGAKISVSSASAVSANAGVAASNQKLTQQQLQLLAFLAAQQAQQKVAAGTN